MENENTVYPVKDRVLALLSLLAGIIVVTGLFTSGIGLPATLSFLFVIGVVIYGYIAGKMKFDAFSVILLILCLLFSVSLSIFDNVFIKICAILLLFILIPCLVYKGGGKYRSNDPYYFFDLLKAVFISPFISFGKWFLSLFHSENKGSRNFLFAIVGIAISIPLLIIVIALLMSADAAFESIFDSIFDYFLEHIFEYILKSLLVLPIACCLFSCIHSAQNKRCSDILPDETCVTVTETVRKIPVISAVFVVVPLILIYLLYFATQLTYFTSAFKDILPSGISYADYARRGFFELCAVGFINLFIIIVISVFIKRKKVKFGIEKVFIILLSVLTLGLSAISASKMILYIKEYGMTQLRVYVMWFIILMSLVLLYIIIKQFGKSFKLIKTCSITAIIMSLILIFCNVDGMIAKYNIAAYENGKIAELDVGAFYDLDASAARKLAEFETDDEELQKEIGRYLSDVNYNMKDAGRFGKMTLESKRTEKLVGDMWSNIIDIKCDVYCYDEYKELGWSIIADGKVVSSGGAVNADDDFFSYYNDFYIQINKFDMPEDTKNIDIEFTVTDANGKAYTVTNDYEIDFKFGETYVISIDQNVYEDGSISFTATKY